ncbi:MAG: hypothetical protein IPH46_04430 [Bacteroidetes bacterium]|nr:hypothetical protein [Bacteroidota bacterium]
MKKIVYSIFMIATSIIALSVSAQKNNGDAELFTYGGKSVSKSEFLRMYTKNINNQNQILVNKL